jgi:hypothetical protein
VPARWSRDLPSAPARVESARVASAGTLGRQALTGLALAHGYDTAFWWDRRCGRTGHTGLCERCADLPRGTGNGPVRRRDLRRHKSYQLLVKST